uniref:Uncharacterized protein n=1 Tax=Anopheles minimus TaxID=112268 RepID=A0A182WNJ9_9DIPT
MVSTLSSTFEFSCYFSPCDRFHVTHSLKTKLPVDLCNVLVFHVDAFYRFALREKNFLVIRQLVVQFVEKQHGRSREFLNFRLSLKHIPGKGFC